MDLYTKNGRPLQVQGDNVYSRSGRIVGRIKDDYSTTITLSGRVASLRNVTGGFKINVTRGADTKTVGVCRRVASSYGSFLKNTEDEFVRSLLSPFPEASL